jgi:hypothetical protein
MSKPKEPENGKYYTLADFMRMTRVDDIPFEPHPAAEGLKNSPGLIGKREQHRRTLEKGGTMSFDEFHTLDAPPDPPETLPELARIPLKGCNVSVLHYPALKPTYEVLIWDKNGKTIFPQELATKRQQLAFLDHYEMSAEEVIPLCQLNVNAVGNEGKMLPGTSRN